MTDPYPPPSGRHAASATLSAARAVRPASGLPPRFTHQRPRLSPERRQEILQGFTEGGFCPYCLGIHAGAALAVPGCPRIATFELDGDGKLRAAAYWPDGEWDASGVYFTADVEEDETP